MAYKQRISTRGFSMLSALFLWWPFLLPRRHLFGKHFSVSVSSIRKPNIARATDVYFIIFFYIVINQHFCLNLRCRM